MPVIPSISGFPPAPNIAQSYLGGVGAEQANARIRQEALITRAKLQQDAQQHAAQLQMQRQKLQQDAAQAEMEFTAKMAAQERAELRHQQELEYEKAYKQAMLGLSERRLADTEKAMQTKDQMAAQKMMMDQAFRTSQLGLREKELGSMQDYRAGQLGLREKGLGIQQQRADISANTAADKMAAMGEFKKLYGDYTDPDFMGEDVMEPEDASRRALMEVGPILGASFNQAVKPQAGMADFGAATPVPGMPPGYVQAQVGPNQRRIIHIPPDVNQAAPAAPVPGMPGYKNYAGKVFKVDESREQRAELKALRTTQANDLAGTIASDKEAAKEKMDAASKLILKRYRAREARIKALEDEIAAINAGSAPQSSTNAPNTNTVGRFKITPVR